MKTKFFNIKTILVALNLVLVTNSGFAQEVAKQVNKGSIITNGLFMLLIAIILILLALIWLLGKVLVNIGEYRLNENKKTGVTPIIIALGLITISSSVFGQEVSNVNVDMGIGGLPTSLVYFMYSIIFFELIIIGLLFFSIQINTRSKRKQAQEEEEVVVEVNWLDNFNASVSLEKEHEVEMDHEYDGIRELDNNLPPWWKYGFYLTIIWAIIYIGYYQLGSGPAQVDEYNNEVEQAKLAVDEYMKKAANKVDENNVIALTDAEALSKGKEVYQMNCAACHGVAGEGGVGPNLTDAYWIHGGSVKDIFKTIKYGFAEKGMKAWQADLTPVQIQQITSFITTLQGTNPANAKAPQGDLFNGNAAVSDSTKTGSDSTLTAIKDTLVKGQ